MKDKIGGTIESPGEQQYWLDFTSVTSFLGTALVELGSLPKMKF